MHWSGLHHQNQDFMFANRSESWHNCVFYKKSAFLELHMGRMLQAPHQGTNMNWMSPWFYASAVCMPRLFNVLFTVPHCFHWCTYLLRFLGRRPGDNVRFSDHATKGPFYYAWQNSVQSFPVPKSAHHWPNQTSGQSIFAEFTIVHADHTRTTFADLFEPVSCIFVSLSTVNGLNVAYAFKIIAVPYQHPSVRSPTASLPPPARKRSTSACTRPTEKLWPPWWGWRCSSDWKPQTRAPTPSVKHLQRVGASMVSLVSERRTPGLGVTDAAAQRP